MAKQKEGITREKLLVHQFLSDMLYHRTHLYGTTVELAKFIATISGILLTVSLGKMTTAGFLESDPLIKVGVLTVVGFSLLSICMSLLVIEPNIIQDNYANPFDYGTKISEIDGTQYLTSLKRTISNKEKTVDTYGNQFFSLDKIIHTRFKNIRFISYTFLAGIACGGFLIVLSSLLG